MAEAEEGTMVASNRVASSPRSEVGRVFHGYAAQGGSPSKRRRLRSPSLHNHLRPLHVLQDESGEHWPQPSGRPPGLGRLPWSLSLSGSRLTEPPVPNEARLEEEARPTGEEEEAPRGDSEWKK